MKLKHLNIIFAGLLIALAGVFYRFADSFKMLPGQKDIGPKAFPRFVCICIIILAVLLIIDEIRKNDDKVVQLFNLKFLIGLATAVLFFLLFKKAGFVLCGIVAVFVMEVLLLNEPFKKAWPLVVGVAIIAPVVIQLVFGTFLKVPLPKGILAFLF